MTTSSHRPTISNNYRHGLIDSPLDHRTAVQLMEDVEKFCQVMKFQDRIDRYVVDIEVMMKRGALLAQDPSNLTQPQDDEKCLENRQVDNDQVVQQRRGAHRRNGVIPTTGQLALTKIEAAALDRERSKALSSLTKDMLFILFLCSTGGFAQGCSQESIVGANLDWPIALGIARMEQGQTIFGSGGLTIFSLVNAAPYFAASVIGSWVSDPLTYRFGRRTALFFAALCTLGAPIGAAYSQSWRDILACRLIQGIGVGAKSSVIPVLLSEVCPPALRGKLLVSWQASVAAGILVSAINNLIFQQSWRLQIGMNFVAGIPLLCCCYFMPESPRWLIQKGRYVKAYEVLLDLRESSLQASRDLYSIYAHVKMESYIFSGKKLDSEKLDNIYKDPKSTEGRPGFLRRLPQLLTIARNRRAAYSACLVMTAQQFSGINLFAFLATSIFYANGLPQRENLEFTIAFALVNTLFSAAAYFVIDRLGRRSLLLSSLIFMFPLLAITGHVLKVKNGGIAGLKALVLIYTAVYSPGAGVIPFMYSSEVFPAHYREVGMSLACSVNFAFAGALAMAVPYLVYDSANRFLIPNVSVLFFVFAGLDVLASILVWLFVRYPSGSRTLEEMTFTFGASTLTHIKYQWLETLPWVLGLHLWLFGKAPQMSTFDEWQRRRLETPERRTNSI